MKTCYKILKMLFLVFDTFLIIIGFIFLASIPIILIYSFINMWEFLFLRNPKKLIFIFIILVIILVYQILLFMTSKLEDYLKLKLEEGKQNVQ